MPGGMFWETIGQFANVVTAGAAAFAAWQAMRGISAWRDEMLGRRKAELAEEVLSGFYQARDAIRTIRSPFSSPDVESRDRPREETETEDDKRRLDAHYVPIARLEERSEFLRGLLAKKYRMKALFGEKVDQPFIAINKTLNEIHFAASGMMRYSGSKQIDRKLWTKWEASIWEGAEEEDEISKRIDNAVAEMERICGPTLEERK